MKEPGQSGTMKKIPERQYLFKGTISGIFLFYLLYLLIMLYRFSLQARYI